MKLEGEAAVTWAATLTRLVRIARCGSLYPDPSRLLQLIAVCARPAPKRAAPSVELESGLPSLAVLEQLTAMREVAVAYLAQHGARPSKASSGWSASLAAAQLPFVSNTSARLVAKGRYLVVHDAWGSGRFTFHLADPKGRLVTVDRKDQACLRSLDSLGKTAPGLFGSNLPGAAEAFIHLAAIDDIEVTEAVWGQVTHVREGPLAGTLHLVLERAATDLTADVNRDPLHAAPLHAPGFHVSRERRICCLPEALPAVEAHLKALGASLVVRSK